MHWLRTEWYLLSAFRKATLLLCCKKRTSKGIAPPILPNTCVRLPCRHCLNVSLFTSGSGSSSKDLQQGSMAL